MIEKITRVDVKMLSGLILPDWVTGFLYPILVFVSNARLETKQRGLVFTCRFSGYTVTVKVLDLERDSGTYSVFVHNGGVVSKFSASVTLPKEDAQMEAGEDLEPPINRTMPFLIRRSN